MARQRYTALRSSGSRRRVHCGRASRFKSGMISRVSWFAYGFRSMSRRLDEDAQAASTPRNTKPRLRRWKHGWPPSDRNRVPKGGSEKRTTAEKREDISHCRPPALPSQKGRHNGDWSLCFLRQGPRPASSDMRSLPEMKTICDEFEGLGIGAVQPNTPRGIVVTPRDPQAVAGISAEIQGSAGVLSRDG